MLKQIFWALALTAISAALHGLYTSSLLRRLRHFPPLHHHRSAYHLLLTEVISLLLLLHCAEAALWAVFFLWKQGVPDFATGLYFSLATCTTIGYGDVLLPENLRLTGAMEGLAGTFMSGWSVALLVAVLQRLMNKNAHAPHTPPPA